MRLAERDAGELGHAVLDVHGPVCGCGMRGCFEAFCSGRNVALQLRRMVENDPDHPLMSMPEVAGDPENLKFETLRLGVERGIGVAEEFWDELCLRMAQGLGLYLMVFNPELVLLGTIFYYSGDMLMKPVQHYLPRFTWPKMLDSCRFELPGLGHKRIGEMAGVSVALYELYQKGEWQPEDA